MTTLRPLANLDREERLVTLIYELLDAHRDTAQLTDGLFHDPAWPAHLDYLRALQRRSREVLAGTTIEVK